MKLYFFAFISILFISSCGTDNDEKEKTVPTSSNINQEVLLTLVNNARNSSRKCGETTFQAVDEVQWNELLQKSAQIHSDDMDKNNFFDHTGSNNSSAGDRLDRVNFKWQIYGENIANGQTTEQSVIESWLKSPPHCKNIMNGSFKKMGIAKSGSYWTQVFATSL